VANSVEILCYKPEHRGFFCDDTINYLLYETESFLKS
jgi:hypothetical protein